MRLTSAATESEEAQTNLSSQLERLGRVDFEDVAELRKDVIQRLLELYELITIQCACILDVRRTFQLDLFVQVLDINLETMQESRQLDTSRARTVWFGGTSSTGWAAAFPSAAGAASVCSNAKAM